MLRCIPLFALFLTVTSYAQEKELLSRIVALIDSTNVSIDTIFVQTQRHILVQKEKIKVCYNLTDEGKTFLWCEFVITHPCTNKTLLALSNYWHQQFGLIQETYEHGENDLLYSLTYDHTSVELSANMNISFMLSGRRKHARREVFPYFAEQKANIRFANYQGTACEVKIQSASFVRYTHFENNKVEYIYRLE